MWSTTATARCRTGRCSACCRTIGSDVGQGGNSAEDTDAATFTNGGVLLLSTTGNFSVPGLTGADEDIVNFTGSFGTVTSGTHTMRQDLSTLGIATNEDVGSLHLVE